MITTCFPIIDSENKKYAEIYIISPIFRILKFLNVLFNVHFYF